MILVDWKKYILFFKLENGLYSLSFCIATTSVFCFNVFNFKIIAIDG